MTPYENVTFKERLHEEAAKLKEMSFRDKFWYIWEYYKFPIIGVVIAVFLVGSIGGAMYNNRFDTALSCAVLNSRYDSETLTVDQYFNEGFRAFIGLDENTKIDVDYSMSPSFDESAMNEYSYAELAKLADVKVTTSNSMSDEEEEELWSYIAGNVNIEREFEEKEEAENILNKVDKVFQELRAKQQPIVSDVITTKIWLCLEDSEQQYSFISKEVAEEWNKKGTLPTQRDLARKYGRDEASISRTVRTFLEKLKREIEQER